MMPASNEADAAALADARRAEQARARLIQDIKQIKQMGGHMIEKTESAIHKAPVLLGLGAVGVALVGVAVFASRRSPQRLPFFPGLARERSFLAEAARGAALSALSILSGRITQRLLAAAMDDATRPV